MGAESSDGAAAAGSGPRVQSDEKGPVSARQLHARRLIDHLRRSGPLTQAELVRRSGLARPTVTGILRELQRQEVVQEVGRTVPTQSGRPGVLLGFNPRSATVAVGRMKRYTFDVSIFASDGQELAHRQEPTLADGASTLDRLADLVHELQASLGVGRLTAASVLVPGRVDPVTGACVADTIEPDLPVRLRLQDRLGVPVEVLNPTVAVVVSVARERRLADAVVIFFDQGIGAGLISGGRVQRGASGGPGELGHCRMPPADDLCGCGRRGCLDTVASAGFIQREVGKILGHVVARSTTLADLERLDDPRIDALLCDTAQILGVAASWLVNLLNPTAVLLGGTPFAVGAERFLRDFEASIREHAVAANITDLTVDFADPRSDITGAFYAALDRQQVW